MTSLDPILDQHQFGCRPGRSTTHAFVVVLHKWVEILDKRDSVRAGFIDYRKAFDIVNHNTLLSKLKSITSLTVCLYGSDLTCICYTVAKVLGPDSFFPPGKHLAAVCPRGPDSVPCRF